MLSYLFVFGFLALMVVLDQLIKYAICFYLVLSIVVNLQPILIYELIPGVFRLRYVENTGAIFGSFSGAVVILTIFSSILVAVTLYLLLSKKITSKYIFVCLLLMASGGAGNLVDRIRLGYVIDYFEPTFFEFAVFNFADCLITVGAFMLILYLVRDIISDSKKKKNGNEPTHE